MLSVKGRAFNVPTGESGKNARQYVLIRIGRRLRYLDFGSMNDSIKLRCCSLSSQEAGIATCGSAGASLALHTGALG